MLPYVSRRPGVSSSPRRHRRATSMLRGCYEGATSVLRGCYEAATRKLVHRPVTATPSTKRGTNTCEM